MVLAKGVMHVEVLPEDWTLDGEGMAQAAARLPGVLRKILGQDARLPRTLFTDRGTGMYSPGGSVARDYEGFAASTKPSRQDNLAWLKSGLRRQGGV